MERGLGLARGGLLDLLKVAGDEIVVPRPVAEEILRRGPGDPTADAIRQNPWLLVTDAVPISRAVEAWGLGDGEASVLAWALAHPGSVAIIDDLAGRRCGSALGLPGRGTLGLVLEAKDTGRIASARPVLLRLRQSGMCLSDAIVKTALAEVGEE